VLGSVAVGAGHVEDDLYRVVLAVGFALDGRKGAEKEIADIGQHSGTARSDLIVGEEFIQFAEGVVDAGSGLEILGLACEGRGELREVTLFALLIGVFETKAGVIVGDGQTAKAAAGEAKLTVEQRRFGGDDRRFGSHKSSFPTGAGMFHFGKS
jgi:hypothetical protein